MIARVDLTNVQPLASGGSAAVFRLAERVVKVFFSPANRESPLHRFTPDCVRAMFAAEVDAWTRVQESAFLRQHTPGFHGTASAFGLDDNRFLVECCYVLDYLDGTADKVTSWAPKHLARAADEFISVGVQHFVDASAFTAGDPDRFRLIDFASRDVIGEDECCFEEA